MIDRLLVGAGLMGLSVLDISGLDELPLTSKIQEIEYKAEFKTADACKQQLEFLKIKHDITELKCVPDA